MQELKKPQTIVRGFFLPAYSIGLFDTFSLVSGNLDDKLGNNDLTNFIWSLGGAYNFSDRSLPM